MRIDQLLLVFIELPATTIEIMEQPPDDMSADPRVGDYSKDAWEKHRAFITRLYRVENKTLEEVGREMFKKHGFKATYCAPTRKSLNIEANILQEENVDLKDI